MFFIPTLLFFTQILNAQQNDSVGVIKVIEGFKPVIRPVDGFKERIILYFILGGILIGCFLGAFIELQKLSKRKPG